MLPKMAVFKSMEDLNVECRGSVYQGSDDWHEFTCTTCEKDGRNVSAMKYCIECKENMCAQCVKQHSRFTAMETHQLLDKCVYVKGKKPLQPSQRCGRHSGKLIDIHCPTHDAVCCSVCVALEHSSCLGMAYLPDVAKGFKNSADRSQFEADVTHIQSKLSGKRQIITRRVQVLQTEEEQLLQQINDFREKINKHLDVIQNDITNEVKSELKFEIDSLDNFIEEVDNALAALRNKERLLRDLDEEDESEMFVQVKTGKRETDIGFELLKKLEHLSKGQITFRLSLDDNVKTSIEESKSLAVLTKENNATHVQCSRDFSMKVSEDKNVPMIGGLCEINDGEVIVTDAANLRLKKLDSMFGITSCIDLRAGPYSVCYIGVNTVAVTMTNAEVQFVLVKEPMVRTMSFNVGERCRGISCFNKVLYVCCGGHHVEKPGRVEVYDLHGTHLRTYFEHFSMPMNMTVKTETGKIYITDKSQGLVIMDRNFVFRSVMKDKDLENQHGICLAEGTKLFLSDYQTNNIVLLNGDGEIAKYLLSSKDGIDKPMSLWYIQRQQALIVTMHKRETIKVFYLTSK